VPNLVALKNGMDVDREQIETQADGRIDGLAEKRTNVTFFIVYQWLSRTPQQDFGETSSWWISSGGLTVAHLRQGP